MNDDKTSKKIPNGVDQKKYQNRKVFVVTKETQRRIAKDVAQIYKNPLTEQGIYYIHDDQKLLEGYAMVIGPKDTPYEDGFYFFHFKFPHDYPFSPPKVVFMTHDGRNKTRFNPNLYINGKVCLSVLNTWRGDGWTACQTISTVLLTLVSILTEKPLLNEPGIKEGHREIVKYNKIIRYRNYEVAILKYLDENNIPLNFHHFKSVIRGHFEKKRTHIIDTLKKLSKLKVKTVRCEFFRMKCDIDYSVLLKSFEKFDVNRSKIEKKNE